MPYLLRTRLAWLALLALAVSALPASAQIAETPVGGLGGARVYRSNAAYDNINQVYLVIVQRPPVRGRFLDKNGVQIGADFTIALEAGDPYTGWANVAFGGSPSDPVFVVTYVVADQVTNPKFARLVRFVSGSNPTVSPAYKITDVYDQWLFAEKAQNVWNGQQFVVGSRVLHPGTSLPTPQVNLLDVNGTVSAPVVLGDGGDYHGSPAIACANNGVCLAVGFMAGIPTGYSGGSYGRLFDGFTLTPQGLLFHLSVASPNEDQGAVFLSHTGFFLTQWYRGGGPGYIDTRLVSMDGTMSTLDTSRSIGPGAGCNYLIYNAGTQTALLVTKGSSAEFLAIELGDDGYPIRPNNILTLMPWDGSVLDYLPSIAANGTDGQWLVTAETTAGARGWRIDGTSIAPSVLPPTILTSSTLPAATESVPYTQFLFATGSSLPYLWNLVSGALPPGINIVNNALSGTPTTAGTYSFRLRVTGGDAQSSEKDFTLTVKPVIVSGPGGANAHISNGPSFGLYPGNAYRNNVAYDPINQVYLVIVRRPPVTGRFYDKNGVQIGSDFIIANEVDGNGDFLYTAWASIAFGGPPNDPAFLVTYLVAQGANPKFGRLVRFVPGAAPNVGAAQWILDVGSEWLYAEKAQSVWNGQKFVVGSRMKQPGSGLPTFQVQHFDMNGTVSGGVDLGNGLDYYGSPSLACAANGICLAAGFMAGIPTGFSGGSYARLFNGNTLAPQDLLFHLSTGSPNEDQGVVYQSHTGRFLAQWFRGGGAGYIDTRLVGTDGTMSVLDLSRGIGPGAGTNAAAYNPVTQTTLLLAKGDAASLFAMELGDHGYPLNSSNWILITPWDGAVLDYLPSVAANTVDGQWLVTWELQGGGFARIIQGTAATGGSCTYAISPSSTSFGAGGGSGSFGMTAGSGCGWSAVPSQSWIHTTSTGGGNGNIAYTVDANGGAARSGSITVGGKVFSISQAAIVTSCSYALNPTSSDSLPPSGSAGLILVSAPSGCAWSPATSHSWIHPSGSGSGNGTVGYTVDANPSGARTGSIVVGGQSFIVPQAAAGSQKADLTSPAPGSTLTSSTVTFQWTGGVGVAQYWLYVGTTPGSFDILSRDMGTALSTVVGGLPTDGRTLYVRLHSHLNGWQFNDYTLTATGQAPQKAELTSPAPESTLSSSTVTFEWTGGTGVAQYWLYVGNTPGSFDIVSRDMGTALSTVVSGLPTDGRTLYVRLHSHIGGWQYTDYTLTAASQSAQKAELTSPAPGSTLTSSTVTFQWTGGTGVAQYWLYVGNTPGSFDIVSRDMGTALSTVVSGLPTDGRTLYVRLHSHIGGWQYNDYTLTAAGQVAQKAELTSPAPGSTLTGTTVTFQWTGGSGVAMYWLYVGSAPGSFDIVSRDMGTGLSTVVSGLPNDARALYVRLHSHIGGVWEYNDYTLTASGQPPQKADLTSPAPGSTLTSSTVTFQWTGGTGVAQYWLYIGNTPGSFDIVSRDMGTQLSTVVSGLPTDGRTLYVRLYSHIGAWQYNDYTLTAATPAPPQKAELVSPAPGSTLTSSTVTFQWTGGTGVAMYWLYVGSTPGSFDLVSRDMGTALSTVVSGLPTDGRTLYVRLHSHINGVWEFTDYTLTAMALEELLEALGPADESEPPPSAEDRRRR